LRDGQAQRDARKVQTCLEKRGPPGKGKTMEDPPEYKLQGNQGPEYSKSG